ncbi:hypothetical protein ISN45_Aa01g033330 [Arabidopsis thaliana x Arabidopsis arenosa]|uniref:Uncharacterized protein n=1 Tax=Arabidopsis thaliana x Arabidopsis arenosa TaxID=1240361 RepID=A0A8T2C4U2_9BRAS|nr:hypothetical protein ISN45_Aa01g033330 [Arabidopsis thaliana x Arabidopsis arenosa]
MLGFDVMQQARAKDIVTVLKAEIGGTENQAVVQAIQDLEGTTGTTTETTNKPQHMEEVQLPDEEHPETEPEPVGQGQGQGQTQTEAEAMQEALF